MKGNKTKLCVFGEPCYLVRKFDDVDKATVSRKSAMAKLVRATVKNLSTKKDNMYVYRTIATTGKYDGKPCKGFVAHIAMGLNGPGRQEDYLAAMRKLVTCKTVKFRIFDVWTDAVDDLVDILVDCTDAGETPKKELGK